MLCCRLSPVIRSILLNCWIFHKGDTGFSCTVIRLHGPFNFSGTLCLYSLWKVSGYTIVSPVYTVEVNDGEVADCDFWNYVLLLQSVDTVDSSPAPNQKRSNWKVTSLWSQYFMLCLFTFASHLLSFCRLWVGDSLHQVCSLQRLRLDLFSVPFCGYIFLHP